MIQRLKTILLILFSFTLSCSLNASASSGENYIQQSLKSIDNSKLDSALYYVNKAKEIFTLQNNKLKLSDSYNILGEISRMKADYDIAIEYHFQALNLREEINDTEGIGQSNYNIAVIHFHINELKESRSFADKSIEIYTKLNDTIGIARGHMIIAGIEKKENKIDEAKHHYMQALHLYKKLKDYTNIGRVYTNIGNIFYNDSQFDSTLFYYKKSLLNKRKSNPINEKSIGLTMANMGEVNILLQKYSLAHQYIDSSQQIAIKVQDYKTQIQNHGNYAKLYKANNDFKKAYSHITKHYQLKDSVYSSSTINNIKDLEKKYQIQIRELEIEQNRTEIESLRQKNKASEYRFYFLLALGSTLLVILTAAIYIQRRKKRSLLQLRNKEKEVYQLQIQNEQLEKDKLYEEIKFKNKELESLAVNILQKNNFIKRIESELKDENKAIIHEILTSGVKEDQIILEERINEINENFHQKILHQFPSLTKNEIKLVSLLKLSLSSKEIAEILNITDKSVDQARYRLRKKLGLNASENISQFLNSI